MLSFTKLFTVALLTSTSFAVTITKRSDHLAHGPCAISGTATLIHNRTLEANGFFFEHTSHSCAPITNSTDANTTDTTGNDIEARGFIQFLCEVPPLCIFFHTCRPPKPPPKPPVHPPPAPPGPKNVCGTTCSTTCNDNVGTLPPISDDCQTIEDAIAIFAGQQADTFIVQPNHLETLTFGTCSYFFENLSGKQLEYCWSDLNTTATTAGAACFPPVHPPFSEGLCTASDKTWAVGAGHS